MSPVRKGSVTQEEAKNLVKERYLQVIKEDLENYRRALGRRGPLDSDITQACIEECERLIKLVEG